MSKFVKLLIAVVLFSVSSQLFGQDAYMTPEEVDKAIQKQEQRDNHYRIQDENKRWKEDKMRFQHNRHHKIRMKHKMNVHKNKHEQRKKFKRKVKQRRLINFLMGMVVGYHIGAK
jgi:ABC-type nickel/cobalt efflux system permease component RcnA